MVEFINFDSADCKQLAWDVKGDPAALSDILDNLEKSVFFRIIENFLSRPTKMDIRFEFCTSKYALY